MEYKKRTCTCGELRAGDVGKRVTLTGWVDIRRDLGGVVFIDLRDRYGKTQVVFNPQTREATHRVAGELRSEYVVSVSGTVEARPQGTRNPNLPTGEIDVLADELVILNRADTPPFPIEDELDVHEEARLQYRYLDLRRAPMQRNLAVRHKVYLLTRTYFDQHGFLEIETPVLIEICACQKIDFDTHIFRSARGSQSRGTRADRNMCVSEDRLCAGRPGSSASVRGAGRGNGIATAPPRERRVRPQSEMEGCRPG